MMFVEFQVETLLVAGELSYAGQAPEPVVDADGEEVWTEDTLEPRLEVQSVECPERGTLTHEEQGLFVARLGLETLSRLADEHVSLSQG
jgi:hypothetical protein